MKVVGGIHRLVSLLWLHSFANKYIFIPIYIWQPFCYSELLQRRHFFAVYWNENFRNRLDPKVPIQIWRHFVVTSAVEEDSSLHRAGSWISKLSVATERSHSSEIHQHHRTEIGVNERYVKQHWHIATQHFSQTTQPQDLTALPNRIQWMQSCLRRFLVLKIWSTVKFFVVPYFVCQFIGSEHDSNSITLIITKHLLHRDCLHFTRVCGLCQLPSLSNAGNVSGYQLAGTVGFRDIETGK